VNPADAFAAQHPSQPAGSAHDWRPWAPEEISPDLARSFPRYLVRELIGYGGMGAVYRADELELTRAEEEAIAALAESDPARIATFTGHRVRRRVAVKFLRPDKLTDRTYLPRFDREIRALRELSHENIVACLDSGASADGYRFFVMPLLEGRSLAARLADPARLRQDQIVRYMEQISAGLSHAHARGWIHRDLKAGNIYIVAAEDRAVILDFGVARDVAAPSTLTGRDGNPGTYGYLAPELLHEKGARADELTDVYSLTALFHTMLVGKAPLVCEPPGHYGFRHFDAAWEKGLTANRNDRYRTPAALVEAIKQAVESQVAVAPPAPVATPPAPLPAKVSRPEPTLAAGMISLPLDAVVVKVLHDQVTAIVGGSDGKIAAVDLRTGRIICTKAAEDATGKTGGRPGGGENTYVGDAFFFLERAPAPQCFYTMSHSAVLKTWIFEGKFRLLSSVSLLRQNFAQLRAKILQASEGRSWSTWSCYNRGVPDQVPAGIVEAKLSPDGSSILCLTGWFALFRCDLAGRLREEPVVVPDAFHLEPANRDGSQVWVGRSASGGDGLYLLEFGRGLTGILGTGCEGIHRVSATTLSVGRLVFSLPTPAKIETSEMQLYGGTKPLPIPETGHVLTVCGTTVCAYDIETLRASGDPMLAGHEGDVRCIDALNAGAHVVSVSAASLRIWDFKARIPVGGYPREQAVMTVGAEGGFREGCFRLWDGRVFQWAYKRAAVIDPANRTYARLSADVHPVGAAAGNASGEAHVLSLGTREKPPVEHKRSVLEKVGLFFKQTAPTQYLLHHYTVRAGGMAECGSVVLGDSASELGGYCRPREVNTHCIDIGNGRIAVLTAGHLAIYDTGSRALVAGPLDISGPPKGVDRSTHEWIFYSQIAVSPDGLRLFARGKNKAIKSFRALDLGGQQEIVGSEGPEGLLVPWIDSRHVLYSIKTRSEKYYSGTEKDLLMIGDGSTGATLGSLAEWSRGYAPFLLIGGGTMLALASGREVIVLDLMSGQYLEEPIARHSDSIISMQLCRDGAEIMTTSRDGTARFWDIRKIVKGRTSAMASDLLAKAKPMPADGIVRA
jgi:serine/threonine protein kinase/WD40 repeat protein